MILGAKIDPDLVSIATADFVMLNAEYLIGLLMQVFVVNFVLVRHEFTDRQMGLYLFYGLELTLIELSRNVLQFALLERFLGCFVHLVPGFQYTKRPNAFQSRP